jgi:hypothetical protein
MINCFFHLMFICTERLQYSDNFFVNVILMATKFLINYNKLNFVGILQLLIFEF